MATTATRLLKDGTYITNSHFDEVTYISTTPNKITASTVFAKQLDEVTLLSTNFPQSQLLAFWNFDGTNPNSIPSDNNGAYVLQTGNDGRGAVNAGTITTGKIGNAISFGTSGNQGLYIPSGTFPILTTFTITAWVKLNAINSNLSLICNSFDGGDGWNFFLAILGNGQGSYAGQLHFSVGIGGTSPLSFPSQTVQVSGTNFTDGNWHFVVAQCLDGQYIQASIDNGSFVRKSISGSLVGATARPFQIAQNIAQSVYNFNGAIDMLGIWTRVLSSDEISKLYNSGSGFKYSKAISLRQTNDGQLLVANKFDEVTSFSYVISYLLVGGGGGGASINGNYYQFANGGYVVSSGIQASIGTTYIVNVGVGGSGDYISGGNNSTAVYGASGTASYIIVNNEIISSASGGLPGDSVDGTSIGSGRGASLSTHPKVGAHGGDGVVSSITGTSTYYAGGGGDAIAGGHAGQGTFGQGGMSGSNYSGLVTSGHNGVVILSIPTSLFRADGVVGASVSTDGNGNTILTFIGAGSYTA